MSDSTNDLGAKKFLPYITQLRRKSRSIIIVFLLFFFIGFFLVNQILSLFLLVFDVRSVTIVLSSPFEVFNLAVNTGLFLGIMSTTPLLMYHFFTFVSPAFPKKKKLRILSLMVQSSLLFALGFVFGILLMRGVVLGFSQNLIGDIGNYWNISLYLSQVILTAALMGVILQFPLALACVVRLGLTDTESLRKSRKMIIIGIFIFVALLPPTDPVSLIVMVAPVIVLFEITLFLLDHQKKGGSD